MKSRTEHRFNFQAAFMVGAGAADGCIAVGEEKADRLHVYTLQENGECCILSICVLRHHVTGIRFQYFVRSLFSCQNRKFFSHFAETKQRYKLLDVITRCRLFKRCLVFDCQAHFYAVLPLVALVMQ